MKKLFSVLAVLIVMTVSEASGKKLAWDVGDNWTENTQVAILVRTDPAGAPSQIPDRFSALAASGIVDDAYFVPEVTYYLSAVAVENGVVSDESNQVELMIQDPLADIPVMEKLTIPGAAASLRTQ